MIDTSGNSKKFVVFGAVIGGYDNILQPCVIDERFDYILFSDSHAEGIDGIWQIRRINYINQEQPKIARYVKTHPEDLLSEYDASLWLDANIRITGHEIYERFIELFECGTLIASVKHTAYDCVFNEMFSVLDFQYENERTVLNWGHYLRSINFPKHAGLFETGLLYRRHSTKEIMRFDSTWWDYIDLFSKRDQLSFTVALSINNLSCALFLSEGKTVRDSNGIQFLKHNNENVKFNPKKEKAWLMHHYYKHHEDKEMILNLYYWIYGRLFPQMWARVFGLYYRIIDRLR